MLRQEAPLLKDVSLDFTSPTGHRVRVNRDTADLGFPPQPSFSAHLVSPEQLRDTAAQIEEAQTLVKRAEDGEPEGRMPEQSAEPIGAHGSVIYLLRDSLAKFYAELEEALAKELVAGRLRPGDPIYYSTEYGKDSFRMRASWHRRDPVAG